MSKVAVVTGASSGIGAEFARQLSARGYDLLLVARREDKLKEVAASLSGNVEIVVSDLATDACRASLAERIRTSPDITLLVNNAGFGSVGLFPQADFAGQDEMHRLHVLTTMALSHAFLSRASSTSEGIINVSSVASFGQSPSNVSYCATKTWIRSFTEGLALELASQNSTVRVQALCPGFTYSEFHDRIKMSRDPIPKQLWMTAEFVVAESLRQFNKSFDRGKVIVIPGWRYRGIVLFMRYCPRWLMRKIAVRAARRYRKAKA